MCGLNITNMIFKTYILTPKEYTEHNLKKKSVFDRSHNSVLFGNVTLLIIIFLTYACHFAPAAAAKSLQSCPILCDPKDGSPPGSSVPGILQARILERVAISFSMLVTLGIHIWQQKTQRREPNKYPVYPIQCITVYPQSGCCGTLPIL